MTVTENTNDNLLSEEVEGQNQSASSQDAVNTPDNEVKPENVSSTNTETETVLPQAQQTENEEETKTVTQKEQKDYHNLSKEELCADLQKMLDENNMSNREAYAIKEAFDTLSSTEEDPQEKENTEKFNTLWDTFRATREKYAAQMVVEQKANLEERLALIDELKALIEKEENASIKEFHNIQTRWRKCGMVPREQSSAVWQTYQHHVERFFDYLKLNREFRDMEFERNLAEKNKIIARAEELVNEPSIKKAFDQLQMLHKLWKEETGPVAPDLRDSVWERFSVATRAIHERRHQFLKEQKENFKANYDAKMEICQKIADIAAVGANSHDGWQKKMAEVEELKSKFKSAGVVPDNKNTETWDRFKEVNRLFNQAKNNYYKTLKRTQMSNLEQKQAIVAQAEALKDSTEWNETANALKALQAKWKEIGHVPRQKSDELWAQFRAACNHFFNAMTENRKSGEAALFANVKVKEDIMAQLEAFTIGENVDASLEQLKEITASWRNAGRLPRNAKELENKFNTQVDKLFDELKINKQEVSLLRFKDKVEALIAEGNKAKFYAEMDYIRRKIDEINHDVQQLKNNIEFFSSASAESPLVREVNKKIERETANLDQWKEKLLYIRSIKLE